MAKITIAGKAVVVTSNVKKADYEKVAKYRPDALTLYGGEDGKEPIFCVGFARCGGGSVNQYGVEFDPTAQDAEGNAIVTMLFNKDAGEDLKEFVADSIGAAVLTLGKLEETIPAVLTEIAAEKAAILENIVIA